MMARHGVAIQKNRGPGQGPNPRTLNSQRHQLALPTTDWFEGQFQLVLAVTLQQIRHCIAYEPGEGDAVFLGQRRQLLVVPFVDADRDPRC